MDNHISIRHYRVFSYSFLKAYIITMRPYLMFVSGITGIAGISFAESVLGIKTILIFIAAFLSYGFGQALTDCFQTDTDAISSPYRPLTQNIVSRISFLITSIAGLTFCISVFSIYNELNIYLGLLAGLGLATYTFFKKRWWAGPFYNAWIVVVLFIMAFLSSSGLGLSSDIIPAAIAVFWGYSNFVLSGYFKDIEADRATGYHTLPVVFGRKISSFISDGFSLLTQIFGFYYVIINSIQLSDRIPAFLFLFSAFGYSVYAQIKLHKVKEDDEAHKAITPVVHSYILLLLAITLSNKPEWLIPLIIFYLGYLFTLQLRPTEEQI